MFRPVRTESDVCVSDCIVCWFVMTEVTTSSLNTVRQCQQFLKFRIIHSVTVINKATKFKSLFDVTVLTDCAIDKSLLHLIIILLVTLSFL